MAKKIVPPPFLQSFTLLIPTYNSHHAREEPWNCYIFYDGRFILIEYVLYGNKEQPTTIKTLLFIFIMGF